MPSYIHHITTSVPENYYDQQFVREFMKKHVASDRMTSMILHRLYTQSGIGKRHSVLKEFHSDDVSAGSTFRDASTGALRSPGTGERNALYTKEARKLFVDAAQNIFIQRPDIRKEEVTHVITVSCTGFYAPGPDLDVVNSLGLSPTTQRLHIGFMGCYAALPALRMAKSITEADDKATVLIVAAELCTLHLKFESDTDSLLSSTVFADGCAAALVSAKAPQHHNGALRLDGLYTTVTPNGAEDMAWTIGDHGFDMVLSSYIPDIIESNLDGVLTPIWAQAGVQPDDIDIWAVHPGGRAIVDKVQANLDLDDRQLASSRKTLHDYGNMSSATVLFVLRDVMENLENKTTDNTDHSPAHTTDKKVLAMAFGPGLTVETGLMSYINS
ncbi:MAG: type III polyketide synthase, partial [Balneolales bacterium]|nr:type III polyketide synthase [Balneolales bacterium]